MYSVDRHDEVLTAAVFPVDGGWSVLPANPTERGKPDRVGGLDDGSLVVVGGQGKTAKLRLHSVAWLVGAGALLAIAVVVVTRGVRKGVHVGGAALGVGIGIGAVLLAIYLFFASGLPPMG